VAVNDGGFTLRAGEVVGLISPNGMGKSTLLNAAMGILPARGTVRFEGDSLEGCGVEGR